MPRICITSKQAAFAAIASCFPLWNSAHAQDFTTRVGESIPFNLGGPLSLDDSSLLGWTLSLEDGIKGGFYYDLGIGSTYDSNFRLEEENTEDEFITLITPRIRYTTDPEGGAPVTVSASYLPVYRSYLENSDLNGLDQSADVSIRAVGAKTVVAATLRYSEVSATDRLTRSFVTGSLLNLGITGTYQIAPRTLISANTTFAMSDYSGSSATGFDIYSARLGALWAASERLNIGPSIRYSISKSDNSENLEAWAAFAEMQYRAGERIRIVASLGVERTSIDDWCSCAIGATGGLSASYKINERWFWKNSVRYVTVPSPTETDYVINNLGMSTSLTRELLRASVSFGIDLNISEYEQIDEQQDDIDSENNLAAFISYNRQLFTERLDFQSTLRYAVNDGGVDWNQLQLSVGLLLKF